MSIYRLIANTEKTVDEIDILRAFDGPGDQVKNCLIALTCHGLVINENWKRYYQRCEIFKGWVDHLWNSIYSVKGETYMDKPDFSSFYKFIVSIGVIIFVFSIALPWFFLQESFDTAIKRNEISELTNTAQQLVAIRQTTGLWLISNVVWFSVITGLIGVLLIVFGLVVWHQRQRVIDQKEDVELEKLRLDIHPMSGSQVSQKALDELGIVATEIDADWSLAKYLTVQAKVRDWINGNNELIEKYKVIANRQIDNIRYDIILQANNQNPQDVLVEVRNLNRKIQTEVIRKILGKIILAKHQYSLNTGRKAKTVLLVCASTDYLPGQTAEQV